MIVDRRVCSTHGGIKTAEAWEKEPDARQARIGAARFPNSDTVNFLPVRLAFIPGNKANTISLLREPSRQKRSLPLRSADMSSPPTQNRSIGIMSNDADAWFVGSHLQSPPQTLAWIHRRSSFSFHEFGNAKRQ